MKKTVLIIIILLILATLIGYVNRDKLMAKFFEPNGTITQVQNTESEDDVVIAQNLNIPWELAFLPNGDMLVTERGGKLLRINKENKNTIEIEGVTHRGEGGLLGLALDPNFKDNNLIYVYLTTTTNGKVTNQVERYTLGENAVTNKTVILKDIPGSTNHDGGRIAFGPDNLLYITAGDAGNEQGAQDTKNLAGKILRINSDGTIPNDNPFTNAVYSYGHRNPQGIIWDKDGQLWSTEHGRSGAQTGYDELNKIVKGGNYGWPDIEGDEKKEGIVSPQIHSGSKETWAPAGMVYLNNYIIFTGLRGESLYTANISDGTAKDLKKYLSSTYGRLRSVVTGPDNMLYILTNNGDGRGNKKSGDDKIILINPKPLGL